MSKELEKLKPCPFCGGSNLDVDHWCVIPDNYHAARVICNDCELDGPTSLSLPEPDGCWTPDEASAKEAGVKAWNRRQQAPAEHAAEPSERQKWLASLFPEDRMFEEIDHIAREAYRRHKGGKRGQMCVRADQFESHLVWATIRWIENNEPPAPPEQSARIAELEEESARLLFANREGADWVDAARADIDELIGALKWAMSQIRGKPRLVHGQNDTYFAEYTAARAALAKHGEAGK